MAAQSDVERGESGRASHEVSGSDPEDRERGKTSWEKQFISDVQTEDDRRKPYMYQIGLPQLLAKSVLSEEETKKLEHLKKILKQDVDINAPVYKLGQNMLHVVAGGTGRRSFELLGALLARPDLELDLQDDNGRTALHLATDNGDRESVHKLLAAGADTEVADNQGHLPRHYAHLKSDLDMLEAFDSPKRPTASKPEKSRLQDFRPEPPKDGMDDKLSHYFQGSFWEPSGVQKWERKTVWNLIYSGEPDNIQRRRKRGKKWFHLPAASQRWATDLVKSIYKDRERPASEAQRICRFIHDAFKEVDTKRLSKEYYFKRENQTRRHLGDEEAVAIVLPVIDIDRRDYVNPARELQKAKHPLQTLKSDESKFGNLYDSMWRPSLEETHLAHMLQLCIFHENAVPQTLDQSYHGSIVDPVKLVALDNQQALTKYMQMLKDKHGGEKKKANQPGLSHGPDDIIVTPYFWLFKIDEDTVLTLYPERWDKTSEVKLHTHLLNQVSKNSDNCRTDGNMLYVAEHIVRSCMSFEASAFFKWKGPLVDNKEDMQISYTAAFADSIGKLYLDVVDHYDSLKRGLGSLSIHPTTFYRSVEMGTCLLIEIDDIIGEIGMIRRIQMSQAGTAATLSAAIWGDLGGFRYLHREESEGMGPQDLERRKELERRDERAEGRRTREQQYTLSVIRPLLESFSQLEADAERVRSMLTILLDLRHREAAIENALSGTAQSTMLFIFTVITVLFAPLSFVSSLLALKIEDLPEIWNKPPLAGVFGYATLATVGLCAIMWLIYKMFTYQVAKRRNNLPPPPPRPHVKLDYERAARWSSIDGGTPPPEGRGAWGLRTDYKLSSMTPRRRRQAGKDDLVMTVA